jgi:hypothetical protein
LFEQATETIPVIYREQMKEQLLRRLMTGSTRDETAPDDLIRKWQTCGQQGGPASWERLDNERATFLRNLICNTSDNVAAIVHRVIISGMVEVMRGGDPRQNRRILSGLLGEDGQECMAAAFLDAQTKEGVQEFFDERLTRRPD